jgi:hypothetical protein
LGSQVSGVVETKVWTADNQPVALLAKKGLDSSRNSAASDKGHTAIPVLSTRKIVTRRQKLGWHFLLRR